MGTGPTGPTVGDAAPRRADRGRRMHGRVALGILIAQDLAVVPMVVVGRALAADGEPDMPDFPRDLVLS